VKGSPEKEERTAMDRDREEHLDRELLVEFALGRLSPGESLRILERVSSDEELSADLDLILLMLREGAREGLLNHQSYDERGGNGSRLREWSRFSLIVLRTAAMICLLLGAGLVFREVNKPRYFDIAAVGSSDLDFRVRGGSVDVLGVARGLLLKGQCEDALRTVDWYLAVYPDGDGRSEAHLLKAAALLFKSRSAQWGLLMNFDRVLVDEAAAELQQAKATSDPDLTGEHIAWFEAKVLLMKGDAKKARSRFEDVVLMGGVRSAAAKRMLKILDTGDVR
jgi:hypothetical protein